MSPLQSQLQSHFHNLSNFVRSIIGDREVSVVNLRKWLKSEYEDAPNDAHRQGVLFTMAYLMFLPDQARIECRIDDKAQDLQYIMEIALPSFDPPQVIKIDQSRFLWL